VYCSKYPNGKYSISAFEDASGNIRYKRVKHRWQNGRCVFCGASQSEYERGDELETHAYEWIHTVKPEEIFNMKFDVIIGNPPYQLSDGGNGVSAAPIFQHFVEQSIKLNPRFLTMIIPARWYAGGKGLTEFREAILNDQHIRKLVDYESSKDCFDAVNIAGGICYFLWDRDNIGLCEISNNTAETPTIMERSLNEFPILIRSNLAISIVRKILDSGVDVHSNHAYPRNPFGFSTNYRGRVNRTDGDIEILSSVGLQYVQRSEVAKNVDIIDSYKVLIGRLVPSNGELDVNPNDGYKVITDTRIIGPGQINTETYLDIGVFSTEKEARNFERYLHAKLTRFLLKQAISSLNVTRECFRFVPYENFMQEWDDKKLYSKYGLTNEEIAFIEKTIRPMEQGGDANGG
jgi:site-specific DNA-methyltransferase (adenine-specific)